MAESAEDIFAASAAEGDEEGGNNDKGNEEKSGSDNEDGEEETAGALVPNPPAWSLGGPRPSWKPSAPRSFFAVQPEEPDEEAPPPVPDEPGKKDDEAMTPMSDEDMKAAAASMGVNMSALDFFIAKASGKMDDPKKKKKKNVGAEELHTAWLIPTLILLNVSAFVYEMLLAGFQFEEFSRNPWLGPDIDTLISLGAKVTPYIVEDGEWYRLFTAMFLHNGVVHVAMNMLLAWRMGAPLEKFYGWSRILTIWVLSGVGGNLLSAIMLPQIVTVGASSCVFGLLGVLLSDLIQNWHRLLTPFKSLFSLLSVVAFAFAVGLLPEVDNFAHAGGFVVGFLLTLVLIPIPVKGCLGATSKVLLALVGIAAIIAAFGFGFYALYFTSIGEDCSWCDVINCLPVANWCEVTIIPTE